jgi:23S rRNA (cytosine1962-C5)-methyltransferase
MSAFTIQLKPKHHHRVQNGHPWVFSNEIADDIASLPPGGRVVVRNSKGDFLGSGYANPHSLIAVRILSRIPKEDIDTIPFFAKRIERALALRTQLYPGRSAYRLVHGEGDGLPGLIIDRYDEHLVLQINTLGMEARKPLLQEAITQTLDCKGAFLCNDTVSREREGLERQRELWFGDMPTPLNIEEYGVHFSIDVQQGQKTGHFFDHAENRRFAGHLSKGKNVLDVYAGTGGWSFQALRQGALSALAVDKSERCCNKIAENAELNGVASKIEVLNAEGKRTLQQLGEDERRFGVVILDPPAFAKSRKTANAAIRGYQHINQLAMRLIEPAGFLFTSSCSYHVQEDRFLSGIREAGQKARRNLTLIRRGEQASDHPILPEVPETRYLKHYVFRVSPH